MNAFNRIRFYRAAFKYLSDPNQVESVLNLGNQFVSKEHEPAVKAKISRIPGLTEIVQERYGYKDFPFTRLQRLPPTTLGGAYAKFITDNSLEPYFFKKNFKANNLTDAEYLVWRARQTHDLWHIVTGFTTSQEDEAGLMAFYYAQMRSPLSALLVGLSFLHFFLRKPQDLPKLFESVTRGWQQGKSMSPLIAVRWEDLWETSLAELQQKLLSKN